MENQDIIRLLKSVHEPDMDDDELSDAMNAMMDSIAETLGRFFGATSYDPGAAYTQFGRVMADALNSALEERKIALGIDDAENHQSEIRH